MASEVTITTGFIKLKKNVGEDDIEVLEEWEETDYTPNTMYVDTENDKIFYDVIGPVPYLAAPLDYRIAVKDMNTGVSTIIHTFTDRYFITDGTPFYLSTSCMSNAGDYVLLRAVVADEFWTAYSITAKINKTTLAVTVADEEELSGYERSTTIDEGTFTDVRYVIQNPGGIE